MKITVNRAKVHDLTQCELSQLVCNILDLLNYGHATPQDPYICGWADSRESIINTLDLRKYYEKES